MAVWAIVPLTKETLHSETLFSEMKKLAFQKTEKYKKYPSESLHVKMVEDPKPKIVSPTQSTLEKTREKRSGDVTDTMLIKSSSLAEPVKSILQSRGSKKSPALRQHYLSYTDVYGVQVPKIEVYRDLLGLNKYCQSHLIGHIKGRGEVGFLPGVYHLTHAEVPEILLELINQACYHPAFFHGPPESYCIPYLAMEVITCFLISTNATFLHFPDKFFVDSALKLEVLCEIAEGRYLNWFDKFAVCHFFGVASSTGQGRHWLLRHPSTIHMVLTSMSRACTEVGSQVVHGEVYRMSPIAVAQLACFMEDTYTKDSAEYFSFLVTSQCISFFLNVVTYSRLNFENYTQLKIIIQAAGVLRSFKTVMSAIMRWPDPTHLLIPYLNAITFCLEMEDAMEELLIKDLKSYKETSVQGGLETIQFWNHSPTGTKPSHLALITIHALCLKDDFGAGWCIYILCWYLSMAEEEMLAPIVAVVGAELMDLAHLVDWMYPKCTRVQTIILEALLKTAGFSYRNRVTRSFTSSVIDEESPSISEWGMEAAVFCKRAACEEKMNTSMKQTRVINADKMKEVGNSSFRSGDYFEAIGHYTEAIATCPLSARSKQAIYYSNRSECYLRLDDYNKCIKDCNRALCLDRSLKVKVQWRRAKAYQKLHWCYPAWLDMRCIQGESMDESAQEFESALNILEMETKVLTFDIEAELERQQWYTWLLDDR